MEWKVMLRGLMAFAANDDAKALENWQRLAQDRMPARLLFPLRARWTPHFETRSTGSSIALERAGPGVDKFKSRSIDTQLAENHRPASAAREKLEGDRSRLGGDQAGAPGTGRAPGRCIYLAIIRQGHPNDIPDYRRIFGVPKDDPDFHRLNAMAYETFDRPAAAIAIWEKYERWLGTKPPSWAETHLKRARSLLLTHLGELCEEVRAMKLMRGHPISGRRSSG